MKKKNEIMMFFLALVLPLVLLSCSKQDQPEIEPEVVPPGPITEPHALILYMQGDNGLESFMDANLQKAITAYYSIPHDIGKVVIFYDRGNYTRLTELYIDDGMAKQRVIQEYSKDVSTVDPQFMKEVFALIRQEVPATTYGLILSSHGGGWVPADIYDRYLMLDTSNEQPLASRSFYGQDGFDCMEIPELAEVLSDWHFEYLIFDACFMASVEALYDLRHCADYIIASSAEVLGDGFPYQTIMPMLFSNESHALKEACEAYMDYYRNSSGTISLVDCSALESLAGAMKAIQESAPSAQVEVTGIQAYEDFSTHLFFDLLQYAKALTSDVKLLEDFEQAMADVLLFTDHTLRFYTDTGDSGYLDLPESCGLTTYIPQEGCEHTVAAYQATSWAKITKVFE